MATVEDLIREFEDNNFEFEDDGTAIACSSLCAAYGLSAPELSTSWEVFSLNENIDDGTVKNARLDAFRRHLADEERAAKVKKENLGGVHFYTKNNLDELLEQAHVASKTSEARPGANADPRTPSAKGTPAVPHAREATTPLYLPTLSAPKTPGHSSGDGRKSSVGAEVEGSGLRGQNGTPSRQGGGADASEGAGVTPFKRRTNRGSVVSAFNAHLAVEACDTGEEEESSHPIERWQVERKGVWPEPGCRYMYDRLENRFNALDQRIVRFAQALAEREDFDPSRQNLFACQEPVTVVGRICCEAEGGRLNEKSVFLEASAQHGQGQRVRLDLRNLQQFSLFPGQVVAVEGENPSGYCLVASRIVDSLPLPTLAGQLATQDGEPDAKRAKEGEVGEPPADERAGPARGPLHIVAAAGPFTTSDNLEFEPLQALLEEARRRRPNLLVLLGPFVDSEHPHVEEGLLDSPFEHVFQREVRSRVEAYCGDVGEGAQVLLVPSTRDAHHDAIFPQPPLSRESFEDPSRQIVTLGNPAAFQCGQLGMAGTTVDILRHLSSEEVARVPAGSAAADRMARLASHLIGQRSLYPLFPPPPGALLDLSHAPRALELPFAPDLLLLPSDLAPFVKALPALPDPLGRAANPSAALPQDAVPQSVCVNPGRLAKGPNGGTFADIKILPTVEGGEPMMSLRKQARIEILRI